MTSEEFVGTELRQKYDDIWPVIKLILYRIDASGKSGLFSYDGTWPENTSVKGRVLRPIRAFFYFIKKCTSPSVAADGIYASDTLLESDRYKGLLKELYEKHNIIGSCAFYNVDKESVSKKGELEKKIWDSRRLFFCESVSGNAVKLGAENTYDLFLRLIQESKVCEDEKARVDDTLKELRRAVLCRLEEIGAYLQKEKVKCFITTNQYNLRDVITIMACRKVGIWTKELSHHQNCTIALEEWSMTDYVFQERPFSCVNESCQWSEADQEYCLKHKRVTALYGDLRYNVVGCPEVAKSEYIKNSSAYCKENAVLIFMPTLYFFAQKEAGSLHEPTQEDFQRAADGIKVLLEKICVWAKRSRATVYVKYHPSESKVRIDADREIIDACGFTVISTRAEFVKAVCESRIAIGCATSALSVALTYGCKCYDIMMKETKTFDFCGINITQIKLDDIDDISFDIDERSGGIEPFDIEVLCSVPQGI